VIELSCRNVFCKKETNESSLRRPFISYSIQGRVLAPPPSEKSVVNIENKSVNFKVTIN